MFERQFDQPLYQKILWNRPISRGTAGRLLIVGGHKSSVALIQSTNQVAEAAGVGALSLLLPDALRPLIGGVPQVDFGPSTPSGSLAKAAMAQLVEMSSHADTTLLGPDASNNSETAILYENFIAHYQQPLILADEALGVIGMTPDEIRNRPHTLVVLTMQQLFKLADRLQMPVQIKPDSGVNGKVDIVADLSDVLKVDLALIGPEIIIKVGEQVSVTPLASQPTALVSAVYGAMAVFYTQNPAARYEGLTTAAFLIKQAIESAVDASVTQIAASLTEALKTHE